MGEVVLTWIDPSDPRMPEVHELRHEALFAPFGIARDDSWGDCGDDRRHVIAVLEGRTVGYACLILETPRAGHVRQVCVRPGLQGSGIGRLLMREVEAEARRRGMLLLWLNARVTAEPFYHRLGYGTVTPEPFPSGRTGVPHVRMELPLVGR